MRWENLTAADFAAAVENTGVCVLGLGVLEKHGDHLPLGTDVMIAHHVACLAAEREPAVVFPPYYFGQISEARCFPGTISMGPRLLYDVLQEVLDEIGRNGFEKIILYNAHGGNTHLLRFMAQSQLAQRRDYSLYMPSGLDTIGDEAEKEWAAMKETEYGGHACEMETSLILGIDPDVVKMERVPAVPAKPLDRLASLPPSYSGIGWYANHPEHYAGDARPATIEKGRFLLGKMSEYLAGYIAAVKADTVVPALEREFFDRVDSVSARARDQTGRRNNQSLKLRRG